MEEKTNANLSIKEYGKTALKNLGLIGITIYRHWEDVPWLPSLNGVTLLDYEDRRKGRRVLIERDVIFKFEEGKDASGRLVNISKSGMYIETDSPVKEGDGIQVSLFNNKLSEYSTFPARVVRKGMSGMAAQFI